MAHKQLRQALQERQDNPLIWNDSGLILHQMGELEEAEKSFRNAILIGPCFAEAYANLAALVAQQGRTIQAARLQHQAVEHSPETTFYREQLEVYEALLPQEMEPEDVESSEGDRVGTSGSQISADRMLRLDRYNWAAVEQQLSDAGFAVLEKLLSPQDCADLRSMFPRDELFEKTVELGGAEGQHGAYRFFCRPLPEPVRLVREGVYSRVAPVANRWFRLLKRSTVWPATHSEFLSQCSQAGQNRTTPILLRYQESAVNHLHRDIWGRVSFPLQLAITLSPRRRRGSESEGFLGGEFVLADDASASSVKARRHEMPTDLGDGVLFCTQERLVTRGKKFSVQPVQHGMAPLLRGERFVLGVPFHNYK